MSERAVFLDRDGTLIEHFDYITDPGQVKLLPRTATALRMLSDRGYLLIMITNQSAIARGILTEPKLLEIHQHLKMLLNEQGVFLDQIYYCPFHPEGAIEKYRRDSDLRKPGPGMLRLAAEEMDIDLSQSWMVGDDDRDIEAGNAAGCRTIMLDSYSTSAMVSRGKSQPSFRAVNLQEAANLILHHSAMSDQDEKPDNPAVAQFETPTIATLQEETSPEEIPLEEVPPVEVSPAETQPATQESTIAAVQAEECATEAGTGLELTKADEFSAEVAEGQEQSAAPTEQKKLTRKARDHEIARRKKQKHLTYEDEEKVKTKSSGKIDSEQLLAQILRELKTLNRHQSFSDFSVSKLLAGIAQMLMFVSLAAWFMKIIAIEPDKEAAQSCLLLALLFQMLTLTLWMMHKD
ncbi:MAG: HAD family hydrolase [Sedimentisphaerales bacterium]|nr:HAD family hydrolase [Sedimentisphaerales bacterium]